MRASIKSSCLRPLLLLLVGLVMAVVVSASNRAMASMPRRSAFISSNRVSESDTSGHDLLHKLRGGSDEDFDDEDSDDEDSDDEDDELLNDFDLMGDDDAGEEDFDEDTTLDRAIVAFQKTPPLTKAYLTASFAATAFGYVFNGSEFPSFLVLDWSKVLTRAQIWRPLTSFLNFGPFGLGYALTIQFVWTYMGTLEKLHHRKPYDFWIMICFGMLSMVIGYPFLKLNPRFLGHNLSTFLVYVWSRYHEGMEVNMFELFNTKAELLPWFFLMQVRHFG
jgi:Derlin-2/3